MTQPRPLTRLEQDIARALAGARARRQLVEALYRVLVERCATPREPFFEASTPAGERRPYVSRRGRELLVFLSRAHSALHGFRVARRQLEAHLASVGYPRSAGANLVALDELGLVEHFVASDTYLITAAGLRWLKEEPDV